MGNTKITKEIKQDNCRINTKTLFSSVHATNTKFNHSIDFNDDEFIKMISERIDMN